VARDGTRTRLPKERGGDQGDALTNQVFPLCYHGVAGAVEQAATTAAEPARGYCYQDDLDVMCDPSKAPAAEEAFARACAAVGLRGNPAKTKLSPGREVDVAALPGRRELEPRALVLRHGALPTVPATPAAAPAEGSLLAEGSPEVSALQTARGRLYQRLRTLCAAGLDKHVALTLLRTRTGSDYSFLARTCGIPTGEARALDGALATEYAHALGDPLDDATRRKLFLAGAAGGYGLQSAELAAPAASAASWHLCLPHCLRRLGLDSAAALAALSPWARHALPAATSLDSSGCRECASALATRSWKVSGWVRRQKKGGAKERRRRRRPGGGGGQEAKEEE